MRRSLYRKDRCATSRSPRDKQRRRMTGETHQSLLFLRSSWLHSRLMQRDDVGGLLAGHYAFDMGSPGREGSALLFRERMPLIHANNAAARSAAVVHNLFDHWQLNA